MEPSDLTGLPDTVLRQMVASHEIDARIASDEIRRLRRRVEEQCKVLDALKTEAGRTAHALSIGWPLPEEVGALRQRVEELERASRRCMEISTGFAAAGIVGHHDILNVLGTDLAAVRGE